MDDFFQIVPLLIANMVDNRVLLKDKLLRRGHEAKNTIHTYDSFLLGVAFILKVTLLECYAYFILLLLYQDYLWMYSGVDSLTFMFSEFWLEALCSDALC